MKFMKKIIGVLTVCGLAISAIPFSAIPADAAILYSLNNGVLTIQSQGAIEKDGTKSPWYDESDQITSIVLQEGVTEIGDSLFSNLTKLETVSFPSTLTTIGTNSFRGCSSLKSIELPSSLVSIGVGAFGQCTQLQSVQLSEGLENIGSWAFAYCPELSDIRFICDRAFTGKSIQSVILSDSVKEIGSSAFASTDLETIDLNQVETIGDHAFSGCKALTYLNIPDLVTTIGGSIVSDCTALINLKF